MTHPTAPLACSLTTANAARQALEWADVRRHVVGIERLDDGVALTLRFDLADVEDLAVR